MHKKVIGAVLVTLLSIPALGFPATSKVDPMLTLITRKGADLPSMKRDGILKSVPGRRETFVRTIVRFQGELTDVESLGGEIRSVIGDIATVDIPLSAVDPIARLPNIVYLEAARRVKPRLDVSVPETGAGALRSGAPPNWTGNTGRGVIIGIIDTGIDLNHPDFKDPSGKSRILFLWDQSATPETPPPGFTYGRECAKTVIDAGTCPETDTDGHGTHVAGIAAGNGSATGNGQAPFRYIGMAPEADLIIVKGSDTMSFTTAVIMDGIAYIQAKAAAIGKPSVINLSLGGHFGSHDGTSNYERGLDNASGVGKVIVGVAGNEGDTGIHARGTVKEGESTTVGFTIPADSGIEILDLWYAGADEIGVSVGNGTCATDVVNPGTTEPRPFDTACGLITIFSSEVNPLNGDREIVVVLEDGSSLLAPGPWSLTLSGIRIANGRFDGWSGEDAGDAQFTTQIDTGITLVDTGTATKPISVGAYNTKNGWASLAGPQGPFTAVSVGDIAPFSSRGPRRPCSDVIQCPPVQKPEIAAPGLFIMSAFSSESAPPVDDAFRDPDGVHIINGGTSMAAPHVTGAVALLLQSAPSLTSDQIKNILISNTKVDSLTGPVPNDRWGHGKLDVKTAFATLPPPPVDGSGNGGDGNGGPCFIATAAYGSYLAPEVQALRKFRDDYLLTHRIGKAFVRLYYEMSPPIADYIREDETLRTATRWALTPIVYGIKYPKAFLLTIIGTVLVIAVWRKPKRILAMEAKRFGLFVLILIIFFGVAGCGKDADGGGAGAPPIEPPPPSPSAPLMISGTVQAPNGQVAFHPRSGLFERFAGLFAPTANASVSGVGPVADGVPVELVRIGNTGNAIATLAATTTAGGRYSFDLTALGLGLSGDLMIQVVNPNTGVRLRACRR